MHLSKCLREKDGRMAKICGNKENPGGAKYL
jgi:hypothetical protein